MTLLTAAILASLAGGLAGFAISVRICRTISNTFSRECWIYVALATLVCGSSAGVVVYGKASPAAVPAPALPRQQQMLSIASGAVPAWARAPEQDG